MTDEPVPRLAAAVGDRAAARWFRAPGRVNLIGDHTDYNDGFVLPAAIQLETVLAVSERGGERVRVRSLDEAGATDVAADGRDEPRDVAPPWGRYVAGVVRALAERGRSPVGIDCVVASSVPAGSGLSSSAALEVALALALADAGGLALGGTELALACQAAEQAATGVPSGIMDQLASVEGRDGHALLIDCRSLAAEPVPVPDAAGLLVVHSGVPRTLEGSAYAERRAECERIAAALGLRALRDATPDQVAGEPLARHVVSENARVLEAVDALRAGDLTRLGELFTASHASLRDDYRVSIPELDALVDALTGAGALGARLTGAGFGGAVVALVGKAELARVSDAATARYAAETGRTPRAFECRAVSGAGPIVPMKAP